MLKFGPPGLQQPADHQRVISDAIVSAAAGKGPRNIAVSCPPRSGKSTEISIYTILWMLANRPDSRNILLTYGDDLSVNFSRVIRNLIEEHSDELGFSVAQDSRSVEKFTTNYEGGLLARGLQSAISGFGANGVLVVDDAVKSSIEANSAGFLDQLWSLYTSVARTRVEPGCIQIVCMTRWSKDDIIGRLRSGYGGSDPSSWLFLDFPAIWPHDYDDPLLGRKKGQALWPSMYPESVLLETQRAVGNEVWQALYQGDPPGLNRGGCLFHAWNPSLHVDSAVVRDASLPMLLSCDWNVNPLCWVVAQRRDSWAHPEAPWIDNQVIHGLDIVDEIVLENSNTFEGIEEFYERVRHEIKGDRRINLEITGDASGEARKSSSDTTDFGILRDFFKRHADEFIVTWRQPRQNPEVRASTNAVNQSLERGLIRVSPKCRGLIRDMAETCWARDAHGNARNSPDKSRPDIGHLADCLRAAVAATLTSRPFAGEVAASLL
jgi:hypothetical protein